MRVFGAVLLFAIVVGAIWIAATTQSDQSALELVHPGPDDPDAPTDFTTTEFGLKYRVLRKTDAPKPGPRDTVRVHYRGTLENGATFDSTYTRGDSTVFMLKNVIAGWSEGLQFVGEGGKIELIVPPKLAYGEAGRSPIPPNATLHFLIELIEIEKVAAAPLELGAIPGPTDPDAPEEFTELPSGLKYRILRKSDGPHPGRFDIAVMHMRTWRGEEAVHSSYPQNTPIRRGLTAMTPGMAEGIQLIGKGGMIELLIPPDLRPAAPSAELEYAPGETMRHIVELIDLDSAFSVHISSADIPEKFEVTENGLKYRIIRPSDGRHPQLNDEVTVNYIGWLHNGSEFDGTYQRGRPSTFRLDAGVIKGWREGLQLIGEKGLIELEVPPSLGYGLFGNPPTIPPDETLHFAIELLEVH